MESRIRFRYTNFLKFYSLIKKGYEQDLIRGDLFNIDSNLKSDMASCKIENEWNKKASM